MAYYISSLHRDRVSVRPAVDPETPKRIITMVSMSVWTHDRALYDKRWV